MVLASEILASAAFQEGKDVQAFPFFGVERRGAPLMAFTRISDAPIRVRSEVQTPHYVVVLDASLLKAVDVTAGLRAGGLLLVNGPRGLPLRRSGSYGTLGFDATAVSLAHGLGIRMAPIVNTAMLGALAAATDVVTLPSLEAGIREFVPHKADANVAACQAAHRQMRREVLVVEP